MPPGDDHEEALAGGRANAGRVVRIGDEVARPRHPQAPFVETFLRHLRDQGITWVPEPRGTDTHGRQRLSWVDGVAPTIPYPEWAFDDALLIAVSEAQRALHDAAASFEAPPDATWAINAGAYFPDGADGPLACHNDICLSNVIVDAADHSFAGIVDFDYVRPVDPLFDIAVMARHWAPFESSNNEGHVDAVERFGLIASIHRLSSTQRSVVVDLADAFLERARHNVRALADAGGPGFQQLIENGYEAENLATLDWIRRNRKRLTRA